MGLSDRAYMRPAPPPGRLDAWRKLGPGRQLALGLGLAYLAQVVAQSAGAWPWIAEHLTLSGHALRSGQLWTLLTHGLLHGGIFHVLFNALGIWFVGTAVAEEQGARRFRQIMVGGVLAGGLCSGLIWSLPDPWIQARTPFLTLGASGGVLALMAYFFADKLRRRFTLRLWLIIPLEIEARWYLIVTGVISVIGLLFTELPLATGWWRVGIHDLSTSHTAHLGGLAFGYLWRRVEVRRTLARHAATRASLRILKPEFLAREPARGNPETRRFPAGKTPPPNLKAEVDRILDKINHAGLASLSADERATLDKARETLRR
jgi:membrane associated rhomboid family serine protease